MAPHVAQHVGLFSGAGEHRKMLFQSPPIDTW